MPVSSCTSFGEPRAKRCRHCDESTHRVDGPSSWRVSLDQDLFEFVKGVYPDWFKNNVPSTGMAEGGTAPGPAGAVPITSAPSVPPPLVSRLSPPKVTVDASPLQPAMDKNKESLKVKLMLRRPINQLVAQGIMPPLKTPPAFYEQRKQLERAKTGDLLKAKIQQRPDRQELERRHILERQEGHVDPSLAERQRMLKKARLADQLNDQISHRPGPLELIKKNILHTDEPIERAVKEGLVPFRPTCEGQLTRPQHPNSYVTYDDDSLSSEGDARTSPPRSDVLEAAAASAGIPVSLTIPTTGGAVIVTSAPVFHTNFHQNIISAAVPPPPPPPPIHIKTEPIQIKTETPTSISFAELCQSVAGPPTLLPLAPAPSPSLGSTTSSLSPLSSISSPPSHTPITPRPTPSPLQCHRTDAPGKDKNRKKSKNKTVPKTRTIKFHEYKGPPNAQKINPINAQCETSYEILLQQQQLFLQWQLEWQHKFPQIILPATQKQPMVMNEVTSSMSQNIMSPQSLPSVSMPSPATPSPAPAANEITLRPIGKLEDMKVSDLKAELKRKNLPVSGSKPQLIERLKTFYAQSDMNTAASTPAPPSVCSEESISGEVCDMDNVNSPVNSMSPESDHTNMEVQADSPTSMCGRQTPILIKAGDENYKDQIRIIKSLQKQLKNLQELREAQPSVNLSSTQEPNNQRLVIQQHLQSKIYNQKLNKELHQLKQLEIRQQQQSKELLENQQRQQKEHQAFQQSLNAKNQPHLLLTQKPINFGNFSAILTQPKIENGVMLNNNSNIPIHMNNKKNLNIVLNGQQAALVFNQLGLGKAKILNGHHRTASLPTFLLPANLLTQEQTQLFQTQANESQASEIQQQDTQMQQTMTQDPVDQQQDVEEPQDDDVKPPPLYEDATKLKKKHASKSHIKSQIVDDVLEILIKNGELPASAAQDPATPTTPGSRIMNQGLVFQSSDASAPPPPPPPPPLPLASFAITLPTAIPLVSPQSPFLHLEPPSSPPDIGSIQDTQIHQDSLEMLLGQHPNNDPGLDLKELGLDLETLDGMDFGQLDCGKLEHDLDMEIGMDGSHVPDTSHIDRYCTGYGSSSPSNADNCSSSRDMNPSLSPSLVDILQNNGSHNLNGYESSLSDNNNLDQSSIVLDNSEFMDIGDMPMEMDDWLDSLMPNASDLQSDTSHITTPSMSYMLPQHQQACASTSSLGHHHHGHHDLDTYDPLLANNQDAFDLFGMDDLKMHAAPLSWDKVDFAA